MRIDCHRPSVIVPAHYTCVLVYSLPSTHDGVAVPSHAVDCVREGTYTPLQGGATVVGRHRAADGSCCIVAMRARADISWSPIGSTGKCTVCGAIFCHGAVWRHDSTGEHIHMGCDCSDKYDMLMDRSAHELAMGRLRRAAGIECQRQLNAEARTRFLASNPGLEAAFLTPHSIVADIHARFTQYCSLSPKQVDLVLRLSGERNRPAPLEEAHVPAPEGRVSFVGEIVSLKQVDSEYGLTTKMVVKVREAAGTWLAWMTCPSGVSYEERSRGALVSVTATLTRGKDAHFAFGKRPTGAVVFEGPAAPVVAIAPIAKKARRASRATASALTLDQLMR